MSRSVQLHISQGEIEKYMMSQNELCGGLTVDATLEEDNVILDVWWVDASTNEEINIKTKNPEFLDWQWVNYTFWSTKRKSFCFKKSTMCNDKW